MVGVAAVALVAHISVLQGGATITRAEGGQVVALRNAPLLAGDTFATRAGAQAELQLDPTVALRLDQNTTLQIVALTPHHRDVRLLGGTLEVSSQPNGDSPRVDTASIALGPDAPGLFRIAVTGGQTSVGAHRGTIRIITPNGTQVLSPGEDVTIAGPASQPVLRYAAQPPSDAFDGFNQTRDAVEIAARNDTRLPPPLRGVTEFSAYGTWRTLKPYGLTWQPHEYPRWAPYRDGRWFWRRGIGWTWIARESWGWIPYHYGAWIDDPTYGWCWVPPHPTPAPAWDPANAVFFAVVAGDRTQSVGWVARAPEESFHAALGAYRNARSPGGIALLDAADFYSGAFSRVQSPQLGQLASGVRLQAPPEPRLYHRAPSPRRM